MLLLDIVQLGAGRHGERKNMHRSDVPLQQWDRMKKSESRRQGPCDAASSAV
jgi:hypothetical protein